MPMLRYVVLVCTAVSSCTAAPACAATEACVLSEIASRGDLAVTRFLPAPLPRAREVIADAMQAAGVLLFKNTEQSVEGERVKERIKALGLPDGDEAVRAELVSSAEDGKAGTQIRVQTLRSGNKKGVPKHAWSAAVLDQAACLASLLSVEDPARRPKSPPPDGAEIRLADSTSLQVRSRHFFFNTDLNPNQIVPFETAEDVAIDGLIVIPAGSLVAASLEMSHDIGDYGRGAKGQLRFKFLALPDGTRLPLRGTVDLTGKEKNKSAIITAGVVLSPSRFSATGTGFAIPAGALFRAELAGEQNIRAMGNVPARPAISE